MAKLRSVVLWTMMILLVSGMAAPLAGAGPATGTGGRTGDNDNDFSTATQLTNGQLVSGEVNDTDDPDDYFKINALAGQTIKTNLSYTCSSNFIFVSTYDSNQNVVAQTFYGTTILVIINGTYYVSVTSWSGTDNYNLTVTVEYPPVMVPGTDVDTFLNDSSADNRLWYRIWLAGNVTGNRAEGCWVNMTADRANDFDLYFMDLLMSNSESYNMSMYADPSESVSMVASYTGWYYLQASGYSGAGDVTLSPTKFTAASDGNNDYANATKAKHNAVINAHIDQGWDHYDWYSYKVMAGDTFRVKVDKTTGTDVFNLSVFDSRPEYQAGAWNWDPQTGSTASATVNMPAATSDTVYYIYVSAFYAFRGGSLTDDTAAMDYKITFTSTNHLPTVLSSLPDVTIDEDLKASLELPSHFTDIDEDALRFNLSWVTGGTPNPPITAVYNSTSGQVELTPKADWFGKDTLTVVCDDFFGGTVTLTSNVTVNSVNDVPFVKRPISNFQMLQGGTDNSIDLAKVFSDNDIVPPGDDKLNFTVENNGSVWVDIQPDGKVRLFDPVTFYGPVSMAFIATDKEGATARAPCNLTVTHVNQPPHISVRPANITINEDETTTLDLSKAFVDPENDTIILTISGNIRILVTVDPLTFIATFKPMKDTSGFAEDIKFSAQDDKGIGTEFVTVRVTVVPVNDPPVFKTVNPSVSADLVLTETESQEFLVSATDVDDVLLNYTWYLDGRDLMVSDTTYTYQTNHDSAGNHVLKIVVDDGVNEVYRSWNVTVLNKNREPTEVKVLSPKNGETYPQGTEIEFDGSAKDLDKDQLNYTWYEGKTKLSEEQTFKAVLKPGVHNIVLEADDGQSPVRSKTVQVTVEANKPPVITGYTPALGQRFEEGKKILFSVSIRNEEPTDQITYRWMEGNQVLSEAPQFESTLKPGTHNIVLSVYDGFSYAGNITITVEVYKPQQASVLGGSSFIIMAGIVAVIAIAAGVTIMVMRRKRPPAAETAQRTEAPAGAEAGAPAPAGPQPGQPDYQPYQPPAQPPYDYQQPQQPDYQQSQYGYQQPQQPEYQQSQPPQAQPYDYGAYQPPAMGEPGVPPADAYQQQPGWASAPPSQPVVGESASMGYQPPPPAAEPVPEAMPAQPPQGAPMPPPEARPPPGPGEPQA